MTTLKDLVRKEREDIPESMIAALSEKQLRALVQHMGKDRSDKTLLAVHAKLFEQFDKYLPLNTYSKDRVFRMMNQRKVGAMTDIGNLEGGVQRKGGNVYYTKDYVVMKDATGDVSAVRNTVIPLPTPSPRPAVQAITVLTAALFKYQAGAFTWLFKPEHWIDRWVPDGCPFTPSGIYAISEAWDVVCRESPALDMMKSEPGNQSASSDKLLAYIYKILQTCSEASYYYYHTVVVFDFLCPFCTTSGKFKYTNKIRVYAKNKQPVIPEGSYAVYDLKDKGLAQQIHEVGYPSVALYLGGLRAPIKAVKNVVGIKSALEATQTSMQTRGSERSATSYLSASYGYAGIMTAMNRKYVRAVSMVLGVMEAGIYNIDIDMKSPADAQMLISSLEHNAPDAAKGKWKLFVSTQVYSTLKHDVLQYCVTEPTPGAHYCSYEPSKMSSHSGGKGEADKFLAQVQEKNYALDSAKWAPSQSYSGYTVYTPVFAYYPWATPKSPEVDGRRVPLHKHYVYKFGLADKFCGIISTVPDFAMYGKEVDLVIDTVAKKSSIAGFKKKMVPLDVVKTELDWYRIVCTHNAYREAHFSLAVPNYSPIVNVIHVESSGIEFERNEMGDWEVKPQDDEFIHLPIVERAKQKEEVAATARFEMPRDHGDPEEEQEQEQNPEEEGEGDQDSQDEESQDEEDAPKTTVSPQLTDKKNKKEVSVGKAKEPEDANASQSKGLGVSSSTGSKNKRPEPTEDDKQEEDYLNM